MQFFTKKGYFCVNECKTQNICHTFLAVNPFIYSELTEYVWQMADKQNFSRARARESESVHVKRFCLPPIETLAVFIHLQN